MEAAPPLAGANLPSRGLGRHGHRIGNSQCPAQLVDSRAIVRLFGEQRAKLGAAPIPRWIARPATEIKLLDLNQHLFRLLNAPAHPAAWLIRSVIPLANSPVIVAPLLLVALWVWGMPSRRGALLAVAGTLLIGQGINQMLGMLWFEPRPFMVPVGHTLVAHTADNGFPSDHATLVWALGAGLLLTGAAPRWGAAVCLYGLAVAWSRVWLGIHFPDDMLASGFVGTASGTLARVGRPATDAWALPLLERAYEGTLPLLRLPPALVPRRRRM